MSKPSGAHSPGGYQASSSPAAKLPGVQQDCVQLLDVRTDSDQVVLPRLAAVVTVEFRLIGTLRSCMTFFATDPTGPFETPRLFTLFV